MSTQIVESQLDNPYDTKEYKALKKFLRNFETYDNDKITHQRIGTGIDVGKFAIDAKKDKIEFMKLYKDAYNVGVISNLAEKQSDRPFGPLMADFDFDFKTADIKIKNNDREHEGRGYSLDIIKRTVKIMHKLIYKYFDVDEDDISAYIQEKDKPTIEYFDQQQEKISLDENGEISNKNKNKEQNLKRLKDGFHICYILPLTKEQRFMIYDKTKEIVKNGKLYDEVPFDNTYDKIFDKSTINTNCWMLYGSRKTVKTPSPVYKLTHIYHYDLEEEPIESFTFDELVDRFSVRRFDKQSDRQLKTREEFLGELEAAAKKFNCIPDENKLNDQHNPSKNNSIQEKVNLSQKTKEIEMAKKLTKMLSPERAKGREDWIRVCWALHDTDELLFDDFVEFSKLCPSAYDQAGCAKEWKQAKNKNGVNKLTIGSLKWWAQQDNPKMYYDLMWENVDLDKRFRNGDIKTHAGLAILLYEIYNTKFKCAEVSSKHDRWYVFTEHRWKHDASANTFIKEIRYPIATKCMELGLAYINKSMNEQDEMAKTGFYTRGMELNAIGTKLRDVSYSNNIITACEGVFYDEKFKDKMDANRKLIGFMNGVYELNTGEFRSGYPDDFITLSTEYDYINYDGNEPVLKEIERYFDTLLPDKSVQRYVLKSLAYCTSGAMTEQKFQIWTGKGCHSPNTEILMFNGDIRMAKDVRIGDNLMGDDSKPRRVTGLFNGTQDMYEIRLSDGSYYEANYNHRMALTSTYDGEISYDKENKIYTVKYHKFESETITNNIKYFKVCDHNNNVELTKATAESYLNHKKNKQNVLISGTIIPMKICDYMELDNEIRKYYKHFRNAIDFVSRPVVTDAYILGNTLRTSSIPTLYKYNSASVRMRVLAGILDKLGSIENDKVILNIKNNMLMNDCIFLCRSLGYHVIIINHEKIALEGEFRFLHTKTFKPLLDKQNIRHSLQYDFEVISKGKGQYYGFSIDQNQRYVLQNMIITYNSNGKSLFTNDLLKNVYGGYYDILDHTVFTRKRGGSSNATPELADKQGKRFIVLAETEEDDKLYVGFLKQITGGDMIASRQLFKEQTKYAPQFKLVMICNEKPNISSQDEGTWRRIRLVPFKSIFVDREPVAPNEFKMDRDIDKKLKDWTQPFMWMLLKKYYPMYLAEGLDRCEPDEIRTATRKYRHENDAYKEFIDSMYITTKNISDEASFTTFYSEFKHWYVDSSIGDKAPNRKIVLNYIEQHFTMKDCVEKIITGLRQKDDIQQTIEFDDGTQGEKKKDKKK